ncbi:MAG: preprotein translocase subunit SecG [Phycisphaerae bacterium]
MSLLAVYTWGQLLLGIGLIGVCGLLILVILVQQASGGGLVGAFGGGGGGGSAFGAKTGDVFTVITITLALLFLFLTVIGNYVFEPASAFTPPPAVTSSDPGDLIPPFPLDTDSGAGAGAGSGATAETNSEGGS